MFPIVMPLVFAVLVIAVLVFAALMIAVLAFAVLAFAVLVIAVLVFAVLAFAVLAFAVLVFAVLVALVTTPVTSREWVAARVMLESSAFVHVSLLFVPQIFQRSKDFLSFLPNCVTLGMIVPKFLAQFFIYTS
jgi:hypothetical protein